MGATEAAVGLIVVLVVLVAFSLVRWYGRRQTPWYVLLVVTVGWACPFSVVWLLPLDLASTRLNTLPLNTTDLNTTLPFNTTTLSSDTSSRSSLNEDEPLLYVSEAFLWAAWRTVYWTMFCITTFVTPLVSGYVDSGYFSPWERLKKAVRANLVFYAAIAAVALAVLVWLVAVKGFRDFDGMRGFAMAAFTIVGLTISIALLSYGLVELPKSLWNAANHKRALRYLEFSAPKAKDALHDAEKEYADLVRKVELISRQAAADNSVRPMLAEVFKSCPPSNYLAAGDADGTERPSRVDHVELAKLHKNLKRALRMKERCQWEWEDLCARAFHLQDVIANRSNPNWRYKSTLRPPPPDGKTRELRLMLEWFWRIVFEPLFMRLGAIVGALLSLVIIWSETVYVVPEPILSIIGIIYHASGIPNAIIEIISVGCLMYMISCAVFTLFKIRLFNRFSVHRDHNTNEVSLCWFTNRLCQITFPLCYNFLNVALNKSTVFVKLMGEVSVASKFGSAFIYYSPICLVVIVILNLFNVFSWIVRFFGFTSEVFTDSTDDEETWGEVEDGRILIAQERANLERNADGRGGVDRMDPTRRSFGSDDRLNRASSSGYDLNQRRPSKQALDSIPPPVTSSTPKLFRNPFSQKANLTSSPPSNLPPSSTLPAAQSKSGSGDPLSASRGPIRGVSAAPTTTPSRLNPSTSTTTNTTTATNASTMKPQRSWGSLLPASFSSKPTGDEDRKGLLSSVASPPKSGPILPTTSTTISNGNGKANGQGSSNTGAGKSGKPPTKLFTFDNVWNDE